MTDRQVRDEAMTLFMAGHETTAVALSWTWYLLAQHPEVDARLADELRAVLGGRAPTVADLPSLKYAEMVVSESMRLYPPAYAIGRQAARPTEVAGHPVPRGVIVIVPTWVVHRDRPLVRRPRGVPPRALGRRPRPPPAALRLLPLRRRPAPVHRQRVRDDGGRPAPGHDRPALPAHDGARPARDSHAVRHPAPGAGPPHAPRAPLILPQGWETANRLPRIGSP